MEDESLCTQIKYVNELHSKDSLEKIFNIMQPLIKKYIRKLYFMEKEDAYQELILSLIEAVYHLKKYNNEAMCLTYLQKSIVNKYNYLCKSNIKLFKKINEFEEITGDIPYTEKFDEIELYIDINGLLKDKNDIQKQIIKYYLSGLSDREIALILGKSRQYINRIKKQILINIL